MIILAQGVFQKYKMKNKCFYDGPAAATKAEAADIDRNMTYILILTSFVFQSQVRNEAT